MKKFSVKELAEMFEVSESRILISDGAVMVFHEDHEAQVVSAIKDHKKSMDLAVKKGQEVEVLSSDVHISSEKDTILMSLKPTKIDWPPALKKGTIGMDMIHWTCYASLFKQLLDPTANLEQLLDDISQVYILVELPKKYIEQTAIETAQAAGGLTFALRGKDEPAT